MNIKIDAARLAYDAGILTAGPTEAKYVDEVAQRILTNKADASREFMREVEAVLIHRYSFGQHPTEFIQIARHLNVPEANVKIAYYDLLRFIAVETAATRVAKEVMKERKTKNQIIKQQQLELEVLRPERRLYTPLLWFYANAIAESE